MSRLRSALCALVSVAFVAGIAAACASPAPDGRFVETLPDRATFNAVAQLLDHRCGTLDCHGTRARNLRIFGSEGLRLAAEDRPLLPVCSTAAEVDEDYASVVGLEPEIMSAVVADHGADPARLTIVRKARGAESHKGNTIWAAGGDEDTCLTSWLTGTLEVDACARALASTKCPSP